MNSTRGALALGATLLLAVATAPTGASAADLYGSIKDGYTPMPVVSPGPKMYFRIDGGWGAHDDPVLVENGVYNLTDTDWEGAWSLGGGVGYYFTQHVRADVTVEHRFESEATGTLRDVNTGFAGERKFGVDSTLVMFNAYYDFDNRSFFTPYVGVGLGVGYHSTKDAPVTFTNPTRVGTLEGTDTTNVAAALMAGASIALMGGSRHSGSIKDAPVSSRNLYLDVGYRFLYMGETTTGPVCDNGNCSEDPTLEDMHAHEVRFGLRYDFY